VEYRSEARICRQRERKFIDGLFARILENNRGRQTVPPLLAFLDEQAFTLRIAKEKIMLNKKAALQAAIRFDLLFFRCRSLVKKPSGTYKMLIMAKYTIFRTWP